MAADLLVWLAVCAYIGMTCQRLSPFRKSALYALSIFAQYVFSAMTHFRRRGRDDYLCNELALHPLPLCRGSEIRREITNLPNNKSTQTDEAGIQDADDWTTYFASDANLPPRIGRVLMLPPQLVEPPRKIIKLYDLLDFSHTSCG